MYGDLYMVKMTLGELQSVELAILKDVATFCDTNNIRYYLGGGTLLGAVRHKGFIPWDDDIDISMPRPDYNKFISTYNGYNENYEVKAIEIDGRYWRTFAKVFDKRTCLIEKAIYIEKPGNAVFIDVFPIDGLPDSTIQQIKLFKEQEFLNFLYHSSAWNYTKSHKYEDSDSYFSKLKGWLRTLLKFIAISILRPLPTHKIIRMINENASKISYDEAKFIGAIVDCAHGASREKIAKEIFEPRISFDFAGEKFWGPKGFDVYLSNLYGNYMNMPKEKNRKTHHDYTGYWKE